jgi:hypothetical protein
MQLLRHVFTTIDGLWKDDIMDDYLWETSSFFFILQIKPTLIYNFIEWKGKAHTIYDILSSIFFLA